MTAQVRRSLFSWPSPRKTWVWNDVAAARSTSAILAPILGEFTRPLRPPVCSLGLGPPVYIVSPTIVAPTPWRRRGAVHGSAFGASGPNHRAYYAGPPPGRFLRYSEAKAILLLFAG